MDKPTKSILITTFVTLIAVVLYILFPDLYSALGGYLSSFISNSAHSLERFLVNTFIPFVFEYLMYIAVAIVCLYIFSAFYYSNNK